MESISLKKRRFLLGSSFAVSGCVAGLAITPFAASLRPSRLAEAEGAPAVLDITGIQPGELRTTRWRKKLIWAFGRDDKMLDFANSKESELTDPLSDSSLQPEYCKNPNRSRKPEIFVGVGICTHLGCSPGEAKNKDKAWFLCACHGSNFDVAGRVLKGSPAPKNLMIPPHYYGENGQLIIGLDEPTLNQSTT